MTAYVRIDDRWSYLGYRVVTLENECIRAQILPELGAKIFNLIHKPTDTNLLWHHPRVEPRSVPIGSNYDDNFSGGWDEVFPNDAPGRIGDEVYPDHGELWCQPWDYRIDRATDEEAVLHLRRPGAVTSTVVEKWITLVPEVMRLQFRHRITNVGRRRLDFLWKLHPALVVEEGDRVDVPGETAELVDPAFSRIREPQRFKWPTATPRSGTPVDFSVLPGATGERDFLYVLDLSAGWCALRRMKRGIGFGLVFPKEVFTSVWLFMSHGGWRGLHTLVLEPCTAYPKDLTVAIRSGSCAHLEPESVLDCEVSAVVFEGVDPVRAIEPDGTVVW